MAEGGEDGGDDVGDDGVVEGVEEEGGGDGEDEEEPLGVLLVVVGVFVCEMGKNKLVN